MLPAVAIPQAGLSVSTIDGIKRARYDVLSETSISGLAVPQKGRVHGEGNHASSGQFTDITTPWTFQAIPFEAFPNWVNELLEDAIIFIVRRYPLNVPSTDDVNRVTMMMMYQVHYRIHMGTLKNPTLWTPEYVLDQYFPAGPMFSHPPPAGTGTRAVARGIVSKGDVRVINHWANVEGGKYVGYIIKKVPITASTRYITDQKGMAIQMPGNRAEDGKTIITHLTQFVPFVCKSRAGPSFDDLCYTDESCCKHMGIWISVGRVMQNRNFNPRVKATDFIDTAPTREAPRQWAAGRIEVYVEMAKN